MKKLILVGLLDHIDASCILVNEQYGFRSQSSTEQATFSLINDVLTAMNNDLNVGGIFCDIQKAFDCVDHNILLNKLGFYGNEGKFKSPIASYLTGRYQKVTLKNDININSSFKWELIKCGVPQGYILGPLFFLLCINVLPEKHTINNSMVLFADDTSLLITGFNKLDLNINTPQHNYLV